MDSSNKRLKIGVLVDSDRVPSWIALIAAQISTSNSAEIAAVVVNSAAKKRPQFRGKYRPSLNLLHLEDLYLFLDYCIFHPVPDALMETDLKQNPAKYPIIEIKPRFDGRYFYFNEDDQKRLERLELDVLLLFWSGLPSYQVLPIARFGVWIFLDHERLLNGDTPFGFWEVLKQQPVTTQCLKAHLAGVEKPMLLHRHQAPTDIRSIRRSRNNLLWRSASFVPRQLDQLHRLGSLQAFNQVERDDDDNCPRKAQSNVTVLKTIASHVTRFARDRIADRRYFDQWALGYKFTPSENTFDRDFAEYCWLVPPKDRFWADPFPVQVDEDYFVFFEEFSFAENKGHLAVAAMDQHGFKETPKTILTREYHLSYPFVFSWQGEWYLIPETQEASRIDVYKFDSFPYKLSYYKTIMQNVKAVDTTLFEADGHWWMFVAMASQGTWNVDELFLFCAETPFGSWRPHPRNPIKSDVRCARPAGRVFRSEGKVYRPAQDCSRRYGYSISLQEIKILSENNYAEEVVDSILPDWSPDIVATHTFNVAGTLTFIDAARRRRR